VAALPKPFLEIVTGEAVGRRARMIGDLASGVELLGQLMEQLGIGNRRHLRCRS
jgi:hypothetical protein